MKRLLCALVRKNWVVEGHPDTHRTFYNLPRTYDLWRRSDVSLIPTHLALS